MANNNIKLAITTMLDDAGIKATEKQLGVLQKRISSLNSSSGKGIGDSLFKGMSKFAGQLAVASLAIKNIQSIGEELMTNMIVKGKSFGDSFGTSMEEGITKAFNSITSTLGFDFLGSIDKLTHETEQKFSQMQQRLLHKSSEIAKQQTSQLTAEITKHNTILGLIKAEVNALNEKNTVGVSARTAQERLEYAVEAERHRQEMNQAKAQGLDDNALNQLEEQYQGKLLLMQMQFERRNFEDQKDKMLIERSGKEQEWAENERNTRELMKKRADYYNQYRLIKDAGRKGLGDQIYETRLASVTSNIDTVEKALREARATRKGLRTYFDTFDTKYATIEVDQAASALGKWGAFDNYMANYNELLRKDGVFGVSSQRQQWVNEEFEKMIAVQQQSHEALERIAQYQEELWQMR